jgi:hypothetical protein
MPHLSIFRELTLFLCFFVSLSQNVTQAGFLDGITNIVPGIVCVLQTCFKRLSAQTSP